MINIEIGDKEYKVREAKTDKERAKGLLGITELPDDEGMLFYFDPPLDVSFWMKDTLIPLDIIFINEDREVVYVYTGQPNDTKLVSADNTAYVLEVNANSGIEEGDELDFRDDEEDNDSPVMKVLNQDGSTQMELFGGERIFRRAFTKLLFNLAKKALAEKDSKKLTSLYKRMGKKIFKEIKAQDNRPPEYVENKNL